MKHSSTIRCAALAITNRIAATRAALVSSLAALGIGHCLSTDAASVRIWNLKEDDTVELIEAVPFIASH